MNHASSDNKMIKSTRALREIEFISYFLLKGLIFEADPYMH